MSKREKERETGIYQIDFAEIVIGISLGIYTLVFAGFYIFTMKVDCERSYIKSNPLPQYNREHK